ncbi:RagB/SusD family nutrient uptake outer membrane protein [Flavobacterium sp. JP2137]|uniref:RagB/SusD family nutrient uptake outer membrane protein n=1 Tax=Flavobacterium sp. JP2137 TaxID=3414510 RepID=UPI003D300BA1
MKKILMIALGAGLFLSACSKDFLELDSSRFISKDRIDEISATSPHLSIATLNGLYAYNVKTFSGGTTRHDDFGQKGYDIYSDMLAGDMNLNSAIYGWYRDIANLTATANYANLTNYGPWRFYYYMVRGTNNVIASSGGNDVIPEDNTEKAVVAEAKALRAYMYYNLMNLYTKGYDANEKILPVYTEPVLVNLPAKNTKEVFDLMVKDLTESISLFEASGITSGKNVNLNVAKSFLAYVYAARGTAQDLAEAKRLSAEVMAEYPLATKQQLLGGFNARTSNPNWIWSATLGVENDLDLVSWWGQVDIFTYSYASVGDTKGMPKELYEAIPDEDVRKEQFTNQPITDSKGAVRNFGVNAYLPVGKFYAPARVHQGQRLITTDYLFLRVEEMYLLNAEVSARLGQDGEAINTLTELMNIRLDDVSYLSGLGGQALKDEIALQTRIELWGEGKVYAAVKRNKGTVTYGSNHLYFKNTTFSYDDSKLTLAVPQAEILNNPVYNN